MPKEDLDKAIVDAARISTKSENKNVRPLLRYLMRHRHTSPFEMVEFKFRLKMPIYIARQHMRHRTASVNEISGRYSELPHDWYMPEETFKQSESNHQGSGEPVDEETGDDVKNMQEYCIETAFEAYGKVLEAGVSKERARIHLPLATMTELIWKIDLHNLLGYLENRMHPHAQPEIQELAQMIYDTIAPIIPLTIEAWADYRKNAVTFTGPEIQYLRDADITKLSKRELDEFEDKVWVVYHCYRHLLHKGIGRLKRRCCALSRGLLSPVVQAGGILTYLFLRRSQIL
jgi:thymidylate synthase (FAD)